MKQNRLMGKILGILLAFVLAGAMLPLGAFGTHSKVEASPATIYVPDDYPTIQAAVNASSPGDTITVRVGNYTENIDVNKDHLTIQSESGAESTIVQATSPTDYVFDVTADYVDIGGFTIRGATDRSGGIRLCGNISDYVLNCTIHDNIISGNYFGVSLTFCGGTNITRNVISSNGGGIALVASSSNKITLNEIHNNQGQGIYATYTGWIQSSSNNEILANNIYSNAAAGIEFRNSYGNKVTDNEVYSNGDGIMVFPVYGSAGNELTANHVYSNDHYGIYLCSRYSKLRQNTIENNKCNFYFSGDVLSTGSSPSWQMEYYIQDIDTSNTIDGKPIYYLLDENNLLIDSSWNIGYLAVVNSEDISIKDIEIRDNGQGILVANTSNCEIANITISNNEQGIYVAHSSAIILRGSNVLNNTACGVELMNSSNSIIVGDTIKDNGTGAMLENNYGATVNNTLIGNNILNGDMGIHLHGHAVSNNTITQNHIDSNANGISIVFSRGYPHDNHIYLNDFNNDLNVVTPVGSNPNYNSWNSSEVITYTYNGSTYTNYLGNYWSDYAGSDADGDGIGDTLYPIDMDADDYPLMSPFQNYMTGGDTTPPAVPSAYPEDGATNVNSSTNITATFSEPMDSATINQTSFTLEGSSVSGTVTYDPATYTATFNPDAALAYNYTYTATLSTAITDLAGNPLAAPYTWSFTTRSDTTPPDTEITSGPSGSINYDDVTFTWTGSDDLTPVPELVYSYYLEGYDTDCSAWTSNTSRQYFRLPNRTYIFKVKARDLAGNIEAAPAERSFTVDAEWSFAIITDLHIGYAYPDYDGTGPYYNEGEGWGDSLDRGQDYYLTERLKRIIDWINANKDNEAYGNGGIRFVVVLGDISDTAEESEFLKAREILDRLDIPYIPIIGNHDVWPYTQKPSEGGEFNPDNRLYPPAEADSARGDAYFEDIFWKTNEKNIDRIKELCNGFWIRQEELPGYNGTPYLQNYVFSYGEIRFVALDCVTRNAFSGPPAGVGSDAKLFGETLQWLGDNLPEGEPAVILSHHPLIIDNLMAFEQKEMKRVRDTFVASRANVLANFAGHVHYNGDVPPILPGSTRVVTTEAVLQEAEDVTRIVKVNGREIENYNILEGVSEGNLPPACYFTYTPEAAAVGQQVTFSASPYDPDGTVTVYQWDFGDGSGASGGIVSHSFLSVGTYNITLAVIDNGGSTTLASRLVTLACPDLVITDIWKASQKIYYTIHNGGTVPAGISYTSLTVDGGYKTLDQVPILSPGDTRTEYFSYKLPKGTHEVTLCADSTFAVSETDETNNCRTEVLTS